MVRPVSHPQQSAPWPLLCALAWAWALHAGCVSLNLPPDRTDSGTGGAHADPKTGGSSGEDASARDATLAPDIPGIGGAGGDIPGSGGHSALGTGGLPFDMDGATGRGGTGGTCDAAGGVGGTEARDAESGEGGSHGGNDASIADGSADAVDAPANDAPADAPVAAPTIGLILYFPCEAADGNNLQDRSPAGNNGQIVTTSGSYKFEAGKIGNGLRLSQVESAYVILPAQIFRGANALTIATWIKLETLTAWQRLFDIGVNAHLGQNAATGTAYFNFILKDNDNRIGLWSSKDGYNNSKALNADGLSVGVWRHVAVVVGGGGATIYVDGSAANTTTTQPPPGALGAIDYAFIGRSQFSNEPFIDAEIDEFRVYNRALSADEIRTLFEYAGP